MQIKCALPDKDLDRKMWFMNLLYKFLQLQAAKLKTKW